MAKPPTVPLYVRIPVELRLRIDAATRRPGDWRTLRIQDLVIEALYAAFPDPNAPAPTGRASSTTPRRAAPSARKATKRSDPRRGGSRSEVA